MSTNSIPKNLIPVLILAWLGHFLVDSMLGIWSVYKTMVHIDLATAGLIAGAAAVLGEGSQVVFGSLSDKGYRNVILMGGVALATASSFLPYFTHPAILFFLCLLTCIGSGAFHPPAASLVNSLTPKRSGLVMTIFTSGGSLGLATSQLIFMQTYYYLGHSYILAFPALLLVIMMVCYQLPKTITPSQSHQIRFRDCLTFFKKAPLRHLYFSQVANQSVLWALVFILPDVLKTFGFEEWICYGGGHLCLILGAALMMIPAGLLADRFTPRQVMLCACVCSAAIFYFILMTGGISAPVILPALFCLGACMGLGSPLSISLGIQLEPTKPATVGAFLMGLVWCVSEAIGPGGVGLLTKCFDDYAPVKALAILGGLFVLQIYATASLPCEAREERIAA